MNNINKIITVNTLAKAIKNTVDRNGLNKDDAKKTATHILNFFGFNERIIDNILEPEDRDAFYTLEEYGLLGTEREEISLYDGRGWRIHYWILKKDKILVAAKNKTIQKGKKHEVKDYGIYSELSDDIWNIRYEHNHIVDENKFKYIGIPGQKQIRKKL